MTEDHTLVARQVEQGILSTAQARTAPHRNVITRAVGSREHVEVDTAIVSLRRHDRWLLCTDGLYGYLPDDEIAPILALYPFDHAVRRLLEIANARGGKDNITAVLVEIE